MSEMSPPPAALPAALALLSPSPDQVAAAAPVVPAPPPVPPGSFAAEPEVDVENMEPSTKPSEAAEQEEVSGDMRQEVIDEQDSSRHNSPPSPF